MLEDIPFWANGLGLTSGQRSQLYIHDPASGVTTPLTAPPFKVTGFTVEDGRILYTGHRFTDVQTLRHGVFIWDAASEETRCLLEQDRYLVKLFALWRDQAVLCLTDVNHTLEWPVCIRWSRCVEVCPMHLQPLYLYRYEAAGNLDALQALHVTDCIECGCCSYTCPGQLPLTERFRAAKQALKEVIRP